MNKTNNGRARAYWASKVRRKEQGPAQKDRRLSPFERLCLLKWSFRERHTADQRARSYERVVHCRYCGNWHLVSKR